MSKTALIATGLGCVTAIALAIVIAFSVNASFERDAVLNAQVQIENAKIVQAELTARTLKVEAERTNRTIAEEAARTRRAEEHSTWLPWNRDKTKSVLENEVKSVE